MTSGIRSAAQGNAIRAHLTAVWRLRTNDFSNFLFLSFKPKARTSLRTLGLMVVLAIAAEA